MYGVGKGVCILRIRRFIVWVWGLLGVIVGDGIVNEYGNIILMFLRRFNERMYLKRLVYVLLKSE